jgi:hypothetical protein
MKPSEVLKRMLSHRDFNKSFGICTNFERVSGLDLEFTMREHNVSFEDWPLFSGAYRYPVPSSRHQDPEQAYGSFNKWDTRTSYCKARHNLLNWLIEQFEAKGA